jgi:hypothetical protein
MTELTEEFQIRLAIAWEEGYKAAVQHELNRLHSAGASEVPAPTNPYSKGHD